MRKGISFKVILVLIIGIMLLTMSTKVFATDDPFDIFLEDQGDRDDLIQDDKDTDNDKNSDKNTDKNTNNNTNNNNNNTNTDTNNKPSTDLPKAGLAEDTAMIVTIVALLVVAVYTFIKISEYSNI